MKRVAKLVIIDNDDNHLLMYRSNHPAFGNDPDLPGGTLEEGETSFETMLREVEEEAGIILGQHDIQEVYAGTDYSRSGTHYSLYVTKMPARPAIVMSWEHSSYEWLGREEFLHKAKNANDTYMHMVHDVLAQIKQGAYEDSE
jgi:8-oxo-dGTP pyrophosphatase MutT (NUDIX family)